MSTRAVLIAQACIVVICFFTLFTLRFEKTKGNEVLVYKRAQILFEDSRNPYDKYNLFSLFPKGTEINVNLLVWNAPILFTVGKVFLSPPTELLQKYWFYVSTLLAFGAIITTILTIGSESIVLCLISGLSILYASVPYTSDISVGQLGSLLSFIAISGSLLFIKKHYRTSGIALSTLAVKPHIFTLLIFALMLICIKSRRREFIYYFFGSVVLLSLLAEVSHPGIWALWIYREEWPSTIYGATLGSLLSNSFGVSLLYKYGLSILPLALLMSYFSSIILKTDLSSTQRLSKIVFLALMTTALFAPYGFIFDHMSTTCCILFFMLLDKKKPVSGPLIAVAGLTYLATQLLLQIFGENYHLIFLAQLIQPFSYFLLALIDTSATLTKKDFA
jgi:hypothetical protein